MLSCKPENSLKAWMVTSYVIAVMLVDENKRSLLVPSLHPPAIVHYIIVIRVSRDWLQTTY